jgi:hypothetical protein
MTMQGRDFHHSGHIDVDLLRRVLPHAPVLCAARRLDESFRRQVWRPTTSRPSLSVRLAEPGGGAVAHLWTGRRAFRRSVAPDLGWAGRQPAGHGEFNGVEVDPGVIGGCGACEPNVSGTVYAGKPDHDVAAGHCLLCVGAPTSALELEA